MDVATTGTRNMGRGIATRLLAGGHGMTPLGHEADEGEDNAREPGDAVGNRVAGGVVALAVPYDAAVPLVCIVGNRQVRGGIRRPLVYGRAFKLYGVVVSVVIPGALLAVQAAAFVRVAVTELLAYRRERQYGSRPAASSTCR